MKAIKFLLCAIVMTALTACSGGNSYNPETCEMLKNKINNKEQLTEKDYNMMIDQMLAATVELKKQKEAAADDPEKLKELKNSESTKEMMGYVLGFTFYIGSSEKDLSPENVKKLTELKKAMESL